MKIRQTIPIIGGKVGDGQQVVNNGQYFIVSM